MIARIWRGWAPQGRADYYQRHYETEVSDHLKAVSGFRGAQLLLRDEGGEVVFTSITWFTDLTRFADSPGTITSAPWWRTPPGRRSAAGTSASPTMRWRSTCHNSLR
jgi:hypothetical protein